VAAAARERHRRGDRLRHGTLKRGQLTALRAWALYARPRGTLQRGAVEVRRA
jgi:hypothetical protein